MRLARHMRGDVRISYKNGSFVDKETLQSENQAFSGTKGISENNRESGFKPAFIDKKTGRIEVARLANGQPAPVHIINWLPNDWAKAFNEDGTIKCLIPDNVAGFVRDSIFYTRDQVAKL